MKLSTNKTFKSLIGQRFGKLVVVDLADHIGESFLWKCKCDCGGESIAYGQSLKMGQTKSCGCLVGSKTKTLWQNPKYRKHMSEVHMGHPKPPNAYSFQKGNKNKAKSKDVGEKIRQSKLGEKNPMYGKTPWNFNGNTSILSRRIRHLFECRQWRSDVFMRDDYTCQCCGKRGGYLEAHHIKHFSIILKENNIKTIEEARACEELWNINNGQTLCVDCHNKTKQTKK